MRIHCDYGCEFDNTLNKMSYDIKLTFCNLVDPQPNGSIKRCHATVLELIRANTADEHPFNAHVVSVTIAKKLGLRLTN